MMAHHSRVHSTSLTRLSSGSEGSSSSAVIISTAVLPLLPSAIPPETALYFHGKITREQAEELLIAHGTVEGLFLLRESVSRNFVISICHAGRVHHYNVERQPDGWYRIQTGPVFVGPIEVVEHHTQHLDGFLTLARLPLKRRYGVSPVALQGLHTDELEQKLRMKAADMGLKGPSVSEALQGPMRDHLRHLVLKDLHVTQPWYHHVIKRSEAERRIMEDGSHEGAFLIRMRKEDGSFVLSLCHDREPKHYKIENYLERWSIEGGYYFKTLMEMIDHYHHRQDGLLCKLRRPVWAPSFQRSRSGSEVISKFVVPQTFKQPGVPTAMTAAVNGWHGSQSLPSLCSAAAGVCRNGDSHSDDESSTKSKEDLISFSDWPNVTRFLLANAARFPSLQTATGPTTNPSVFSNSRNSSVRHPTPTSNFFPNSTLRKSPILKRRFCSDDTTVSRVIQSLNSPAHFNKTNGCLQPVRLGQGSPTTRVKDEINAAIADVVSNAFKAVRSCTNGIHKNGSDKIPLLPEYGSTRSLAETNVTEVTCLQDAPGQSLHFPPILDTPWEEPDLSEDITQSSNSGSNNDTEQDFKTPTPQPPMTNPFLSMLDTSSDDSTQHSASNVSSIHSRPIMTHSPDVSTFCSASCCQNRVADRGQCVAERTQLIYDDLPPSNLLISRNSVILAERLGGGNFGHVVRGIYRTTCGQEVPVAVKTLKPCQLACTGEKEILAEARTMVQLKHRHIVRLIGVCKEEQIMLILELAPLGPINKYLKKHRDVSVHTLTELMHQVALGMAYLESCKFVHRDLAARNVLLVTRHYAKISDFGMSKALNFGSDYYRAAAAGKWPLKWYAPECIYYFRFDSKSDVWSYGVTLWEVYSYGERPYRDMKGAQILAMLDQGLRLSKPLRCPDSVYTLMHQCWYFDGSRRPTFSEVVSILGNILKQIPIHCCLLPQDNSRNIARTPRLSLATSGSGGSGANSGASDVLPL